MLTFDWDGNKAARNQVKHDVSFNEAITVFSDINALTFFDTEHSQHEERNRIYGVSNKGRVLVVVFTYRLDLIRLISARKATNHEQKIYDNQ